MGSKLDNALDVLAQWVERNKAITDLAEALKEIPSIEQAVSERKSALLAAITEHEHVKVELTRAQDELAATRAQIAALKTSHETEAAKNLSAAGSKATSIVSDAKSHAAEIIAAAHEEAGRVQAAHEAAMVNARQTLADTKAQAAQETDKLASAKREHAEVAAKIESLKSVVKTIIGQS